MKKRIILASSSPRRKMLLEQIGLRFETIPSEINEMKKRTLCEDPIRLVEKLALEKAKDVSARVKNGIVIAADTVVILNGEVIGKPKDEEEAISILKRLSGKTHEVATCVVVMDAGNGRTLTEVVRSKVKFRDLSDEEILGYVKTGEPLDKAGGYGIQGIGSILVERLDGCFYNVVGLPLSKLAEMLKAFGINVLKG